MTSKGGRTVWFQFWDTKLTYERSYLARLNYVHQKTPKAWVGAMGNQYRGVLRHGLNERFRSYRQKRLCFKTDRLNIHE